MPQNHVPQEPGLFPLPSYLAGQPIDLDLEDGDGFKPSWVVALVVKLVRETYVTATNQGFDGPRVFQEAISVLVFAGLNCEDLDEVLGLEGSGCPESLAWSEGRRAPQEDRFRSHFFAGYQLLLSDGLLISGRRFDVETGRPR